MILTLLALTGAQANDPKPQPALKGTIDMAQSTVQLREAEENYHRGIQAADGIGVARDYFAAARYYRKAAESGIRSGTVNLAYLYENGWASSRTLPRLRLGIAKPRIRATRKRRTISELSIHRTGRAAQLYGGCAPVPSGGGAGRSGGLDESRLHVPEGRGVERDPTQAFQMFTKAADRGYAVAQNNLALMYANGEGVKRDSIGPSWLDLAAAEIPKAVLVRDALAKDNDACSTHAGPAIGHSKAKRALNKRRE